MLLVHSIAIKIRNVKIIQFFLNTINKENSWTEDDGLSLLIYSVTCTTRNIIQSNIRGRCI